MAGFGWRDRIIDRGWHDVRAFLSNVDWHDRPDYLFEIIDSVIAHGADRHLAVTTSMHDLIIAQRPVGDPPYDVVAVRAPGSLRGPSPGTVLIEHLSVMGKNTTIQRPAAEALPLFWRFMETEFGLRSAAYRQAD